MKLNGKNPRKIPAQNLQFPCLEKFAYPHSSFTGDRVKYEQHLLYSIFSENDAAYFFRN
jgi:hypothetical protein